mgnify:CR=1 FL=1
MVEVETINHKNHRSWLAWSGRIFLAVVITIIATIAHGSTTMALSNVGPSSPGDRYNFTEHSTHKYRELEVPVYFKDNPGSVRVFVEDTKWGGGAYFNGTPIYGSGGEFTVSGFQYDNLTGYWKGVVRAHMIGSAMFQFKLRLERSDGIIAYGTGRASQADGRYNNVMTDNDGHYDKTMEMALPCSFTEPTHLGGPGSPYRLKLYDLDTWYPGWRNNNGKQPLSVSVYDESDGGREVAYYDGNDPEYQCGQLGAGDDGVYGKHGCMGENGVLYVEMTMLPGHKYKLVIHNVWKNNLIEYELPFDNIFYNISCEPNIDMRTTVDFTKKPTGDPKKQPRTGYKWLSSYGKYNSKNNNDSIAEVMGYPGTNKPNTPNTLWTWTGNYPHVIENLPKAVMDKNHHKAELYPGDELTWWFRAYNVGGSGFDSSPSTDFANYREGWIDPLGQNWNRTEPKPEWMVNVFKPSERGGPLNGEGGTHHQVMWGCYNWGKEKKCTDYFKGFDPSNLNEGASISEQEAVNRHYRYIVKSGDAGQTLCQWLRMSWNNGSWQQRFTPKACVYIPYHYPPPPDDGPKDKSSGIVPITIAKQDKVQAGDTVTFDYKVENPTGPTKTRPFEYHNYTFILKRGTSLPTDKEDRPTYPKFWDGKGVSCKGGRSLGSRWNDNPSLSAIYPCVGWDTGATGVVLNVGESHTSSKSYGIYGSDWLAQPGDKICSYIAVDNNWSVRNDQSADTFRASNIACAVVTKSPNLNLSGSDSYADKGFQGASVSKSDMVPGTDKRGSYSQYGLLTGKVGVTNFGSAGYTTADNKYHRLACKLSYANTGNVKDDCKDLSGLGSAGLSRSLSMPSPTNATPLTGGSNVDLSNLPSGNYNYTGSVPLNISGNLDKKGKHITIFAEKTDVTITGKIDADAGPYADLSDIPSFTIMAKNIKVNPGVSLITGTYVAKGHFESCKDAKNPADLGMLPNSKCQNKLKVNGAIVSENSPIFRRTFGAGNLQEDNQWKTDRISSTAEWINYTPNLWLTTSNGSSGNQLEGLTTTQVTNLPVRY